MNATRRAASALLVLSTVAVLAGCNSGNVFELSVGDCFDDNEAVLDGEVSDVPIVDCDEPHDNEVYALASYAEDDDYPGEAAVEERAETECHAAFEPYVGTPYAESTLYFGYLTPTSTSWIGGDREIVCLLFEFDDSGEPVKLEGSVKASGR